MTRANRTPIDAQFDLFLPYLSDLPMRDQREMMERPFFSLAKAKRLKAIDYRSPDGKVWVHVSANPDYGMATIWDADILIYCASMISDMRRRGLNDIPRTLHIMPFDLLRAIGRPTTGRAYELLGQALDRLQSTTVKTNIRADNRREATFSWLDSWSQLVDEKTERSRGMSLSLAGWFYEGLMMEGGVLSIDRAYFDISGGRERWLYKVARKHAGGAGEGGFAITMPTLFEKSGAEGQYRRFKFEIAKIAEKDALPGYALRLEQPAGKREPALRMIRRPAAAGAAIAPRAARVGAKRAASLATNGDAAAMAPGGEGAEPAPLIDAMATIRRTVTSLSTRATQGWVTDDTLATLRAECPGWDYQTLHQQFREWVEGDPARTPANYQNAFIGFVRGYHARNKHQLGR
ncbi:replication initiator protein A [Sphingomonas morindae]|uniref:Replication initiator protein A n=1 Tax=Sphingomonas morindae TaxID=1541170 RepID=A0ABY4XDF9_9SPHN|nr:replication initiator protein A [Sphingomonas morindae]USI74879.1 replication initiator protein A [Sphingomonas morindae]